MSVTTKKKKSRKQMPLKSRAVFVDRDGTLNDMVYDETHGVLDSPRRPSQVRACKGAALFIKGAKRLGFKVVVVTNQPGIAKNTLTLSELGAVNRELAVQLRKEGARWDALEYCPHHPNGDKKRRAKYVKTCACRKPKPGLILRAAKSLGLDLGASWMVGDGLNDIQAGRAAGCRTVLIARLKPEQVERFFGPEMCEPYAVAANLVKALKVIKEAEAS